MKKITKTIKTIILIFAILIAGSNAVGVISQEAFDKPLPMIGDRGFAIVQSGSMSPTLEVNDMIFFKAQEKYELGDIIVFKEGDRRTVHRIVGFKDGKIITKGDFNNTKDEELRPKEDVIGRVGYYDKDEQNPARIPWIGHLYTLEEPYLWLLIGLVLAIAIWDMVVPNSEERSEEEEIDDEGEEL